MIPIAWFTGAVGFVLALIANASASGSDYWSSQMMHSRNGVALSALAATFLLTSSPLAQEDSEREIEVHYCVTDSSWGRASGPGIKVSKVFSTSTSGLAGSVVGTVSFPEGEALADFRNTMQGIGAGTIRVPEELSALRPFLHPGTRLGNAEFRSEFGGGSRWLWSKFEYERREPMGYSDVFSEVVSETRYEFRVAGEVGTLLEQDRNGQFVETATYYCATLPNL